VTFDVTVGIDLDLHGVLFGSVVGSIPGGGSQSRPRRHPLGRNYQDPAAHLFDQLVQIVEQSIDLRVAQVSEFDSIRALSSRPAIWRSSSISSVATRPTAAARATCARTSLPSPVDFATANSSANAAIDGQEKIREP
jgi:hypothetical protein